MIKSQHFIFFASFGLLFAAYGIAQGRQLPSPAAFGATPAAKPSTYEEAKRETNDIVVSIVVSGLTCTCARFAEDTRNVVNDLRPNGIRVLPVLGVGGLQNLKISCS